MELIQKSGHNEMCGGYSYDYEVKYSGHTLKEVLEEIKEFTNNDKRFVKIDEYGYDERYDAVDKQKVDLWPIGAEAHRHEIVANDSGCGGEVFELAPFSDHRGKNTEHESEEKQAH